MELLFFIDFFHVSEHSKHFSIHLYIFLILFLIDFRGMGGGVGREPPNQKTTALVK